METNQRVRIGTLFIEFWRVMNRVPFVAKHGVEYAVGWGRHTLHFGRWFISFE